jgi:hypothetical protein
VSLSIVIHLNKHYTETLHAFLEAKFCPVYV